MRKNSEAKPVAVDAGVLDWKVMRMASARRSSRSKRSLATGGLWLAAALVVFGAFAAGYFWRQSKDHSDDARGVGPVNIEESRRADALRSIDEAVRARYEERWQGAMNALREARQVDLAVRGVDVLLGEIALEQRDATTLRQATREALRRGENESSAYLLLALESWMQRGETGTAKAGDSAKQHLADAAEAEPSNAAVYFFLGELNRLLGESGAAFSSLRGALARQEPWDSSALISVKMQLAARKASEVGHSIWVPMADEQGGAVLALREAPRDAVAESVAVEKMLAVMPSLQAAHLLADVDLSSVVPETGLAAKLCQVAAWALGKNDWGEAP